MATIASHREHARPNPGAELTPQRALRYAWSAWLAMLVVPFLLFIYIAATTAIRVDPLSRAMTDRWFLGSVAYMVIAVPLSFFIRSRCFQAYWRGDCVAPRDYLKGMMTTWVALEIGGLLSLTGCLVTASLPPCMFPALVAFMAFVALWPNGRAMVCAGRGASDDPENYEEPR